MKKSNLYFFLIFSFVIIISYLLINTILDELNFLFVIDLESFLFIIYILFTGFNFAKSLSSDGISLRVMYWYFALLFLGIPPFIQHVTGLWRFSFDESYIIWTQFLLIFSHLIFIYSYNSVKTIKFSKKIELKNYTISFKKIQVLTILLTIITILSLIFVGFSPSESIVRKLLGYSFSPIENILEFLIRPLFFINFLFIILFYKSGIKRKNFFLFALLMFFNVIVVIGPFSGARSIIFFLYFGLAVILIPPSWKNSLIYFGFLIIGVFGSFIQTELRNNFSDGSEINAFNSNYMLQGHFDGFENLCHLQEFVSTDGITWGNQLLGVVFFYIPRSIWESKPIGTGEFLGWEFLSRNNYLEWANFGMPLQGEAFINFHIVGIAFLFFILGKVCSYWDKKYLHLVNYNIIDKNSNKYISFRKELILYPISLGVLFFTLRGDLLTATSFGVGLFVSFYLTYFLVVKKI